MPMLENFDSLIEILDYSLSSKRRRHIAGGILLSISLLFGGLAFTIVSMKEGEEQNETTRKENRHE